MSPAVTGRCAYWHSGGGIESRSGPLSRQQALDLVRFYAGELAVNNRRNDAGAVLFCTRSLLAPLAAMLAADAWRRAAKSSCVG